jgi:hypothetical protein
MREAIYTSGYLGIAPVVTSKLMQQPGWEESYFLSAGAFVFEVQLR